MKGKDLYRQVLLTTAEVTAVSVKDILGKGRRQDIVDARWIVVILMCDKGFYTGQIARMMNLSERHVDRILGEYQDRLRYGGAAFKTHLRNVRDILL